ncbi:hypothetical protein HpNP41_14770 [Helicobacter pylori]
MKFFKIPKLHLNSKECQENIFRKLYSLFFKKLSLYNQAL